MAMVIAPEGPLRDALRAALGGGDVRSAPPEHPDLFGASLGAGSLVYAPTLPADPERMRRVLGAANAPGVKLVVVVRPPGRAFEPEELVLRRHGKPFVVLAAAADSPHLAAGVQRALSEGALQGRVIDLDAPAPAPPEAPAPEAPAPEAPAPPEAPVPPEAPAPARPGPPPAPTRLDASSTDMPKRSEASSTDAPASDPSLESDATPARARASSSPRALAAAGSPDALSVAAGSPDAPSVAARSLDAAPGAVTPSRRWALTALAAVALLAALSFGKDLLPAGCSSAPPGKALAPAAR